MSRRSRAGSDRDLRMSAEINVTSLIDLAFTLLIIFIITAPVLQGGIEVKLPESQVRPVSSQENPLIISVTADNEIFIDETEVDAGEFDAVFAEMFAEQAPSAVFIRGDEAARYGALFGVMGTVHRAAQESGITVSLVGVDPPRSR